MTPFGLAFEWLDYQDEESYQLFFFTDAWNAVDSIIDIIFMLEIIICFNTSYYYEDDDRKELKAEADKKKRNQTKNNNTLKSNDYDANALV